MSKKQYLVFLCVFSILFSYFSCVPGGNESTTTTSTTIEFYPKFNPIGGVYKDKVVVTISSGNQGAKIYYTVDGTTPSSSSKLYDTSFELKETTLVRAIAISEGKSYYSMTTFDIDDTTRVADITNHYASPQNSWRDELIYFVLTDRFYDGDKTNNKQTTDGVEYGAVEAKYNGGDFKGLMSKLDYIKSMGFTTIWLTAPVDNQYWQGGSSNYGGYHGYWASDFKNTDPHYGTINEYKALVDAAHEKGLKVIQDVIVNHTGDYFSCSSKLTGPKDTNYKLKEGSLPYSHPVQIPWKYNDPSIFTEDEFKNNSFYHWTPIVKDFTNLESYFDNQMSDLDDMNTDNPIVANLLRGYFRFWIDKVGIDGYRVDTVMYVRPEFFEGFVNSTETGNMGVRKYAESKGKNDFILFGEAFNSSDAVSAKYTKDPDTGVNRLDSAIYFPLRYKLVSVFTEGKSTSLLTDTLNNRYKAGYANPDKLVTFVDNHDVARILSLTDSALAKACYAFIMTIPGIPCVYYGTEQGFTVQRRAMFNGGYAGNGVTNTADMFIENGEWYDYIKAIVALRKNNSVFKNGSLTPIKDNSSGAGIFSYKMVEGLGGIDKSALIIFNTSGTEITASLETGFTKGDNFVLKTPFIGNFTGDLVIGESGKVNIKLDAKSFAVYILKTTGAALPTQIDNTINITNNFDVTVDVNSLSLMGTLKNDLASGQSIKILVDNVIQTSAVVVNSKNWSCELNLLAISDGVHKLVAFIDTGDIQTYVMSQEKTFGLEKPYTEVASVSDPDGDDIGPKGKNYTLPTHPSFAIHPEDILNVKVYTAGGNMKIEMTMKGISKVWNPTYGFDHVSPSIFIKKKDSTSTANFNPNHNYTLPDGFTWDYLFRPAGWNISMFEKTGATKTNNGTAVTPLPIVTVGFTGTESTKEPGTLTFTISSEAIGNPTSLSGYQIYISTWDEDNGTPRGLVMPVALEFKFGGGDGNIDPLVIDETSIITIP